jgi:hypothetical protein
MAADLVVAEDERLSGLHFAVRVDSSGCHVRDLGSLSGTRLNGRKVIEAFAPDGSTIEAGNSTFLLSSTVDEEVIGTRPTASRAGGGPPRDEVGSPGAAVLGALGEVAGPLFALLDAARDPRVLQVLRRSGERHQSLYEGAKGDELAEFAPYLVELPPVSPLRVVLVSEGWGRGWGVYLSCPLPYAEVRKHFRRFLLVKSAEDGRTLYFRFYDPRVLRLFLPTCSPTEVSEFFGPIREFLLEGADPATMLRFTPGVSGAEQATLPMAVAKGAEAPG